VGFVVTIVADVKGAFTVEETDTTLAAGEMKIAGVDAGVDDDDRNVVRDDGRDAGDGTGTPVKTVLPNGCALGDDNDGVTAPSKDALFP
jgi:hypothetical protein